MSKLSDHYPPLNKCQCCGNTLEAAHEIYEETWGILCVRCYEELEADKEYLKQKIKEDLDKIL